jgi:hypothetical protein
MGLCLKNIAGVGVLGVRIDLMCLCSIYCSLATGRYMV